MSEAADGLMPEASLNANLNKDVFDVLLQNVRSTASVSNASHCVFNVVLAS